MIRFVFCKGNSGNKLEKILEVCQSGFREISWEEIMAIQARHHGSMEQSSWWCQKQREVDTQTDIVTPCNKALAKQQQAIR